MNYIDKNYYLSTYKGTVISNKDDITKYIKKACLDIDTLTFNRIVARGFENLTTFQQNIIKDVLCEHAEFLFENSDLLDSVLSSYSINGVSMSFENSENIKIIDGVVMKQSLYQHLGQTGLTNRNLRY